MQPSEETIPGALYIYPHPKAAGAATDTYAIVFRSSGAPTRVFYIELDAETFAKALTMRAAKATLSIRTFANQKKSRKACPRDGHPKGLAMLARAPHPCPFKSEMHGDKTTLCRCCSACTAACAEGV